jgi:hypothetical protein
VPEIKLICKRLEPGFVRPRVAIDHRERCGLVILLTKLALLFGEQTSHTPANPCLRRAIDRSSGLNAVVLNEPEGDQEQSG